MKIYKLFLLLACLLASCPAAHAKVLRFAVHQVVDDNTVSLSFYSPSIVRVRVSPGTTFPAERKSYSVTLKAGEKLINSIETKQNGDSLYVWSSNLKLSLNKVSGDIVFRNKEGRQLLKATTNSLTPCSNAVDAGKFKVSQTFRLDLDEAIYGLGQLRDTAMNQRNRHVKIWNYNTYISIPYFTSEKGYGLYWDNAGRSTFNDNDRGTTFTSEVAPYIDYYFMYKDGTQDGVISCIRDLTGRATMFPLWTMGFWQCRERYKTSDELASVLDRYRELQIPLDGIVQDWQYWGCDSNWNAMKFMNPYYINKVGDKDWAKYLPGDMKNLPIQKQPRLKSPEEMVNYVHDNNAHLMITIWASFGPWTKQFQELKAIKALYPFDTYPRNHGALAYDVFNPKARQIYWNHLTHLYNMGLDAWWTDSTEPEQYERPGDDDYMTADGSWRSVKNAYPIVHNRGIYEQQRAMKDNHKRIFLMTRSGSFGIQHYGTSSWSGDVMASWAEMKNQIPSGLNYTLCGIPFWNTDLGGFFYGEFEQDPKNPALQELQTRWMQWGTFMPIMRNHCASPMVNELYLFGKEGDWAYDVMKSFIKLRYRLLPYIYSTAADCVFNSGSMMRALVMDFANDRHASRLNDTYMFGRSLLVKPVTDALYTWKDKDKRGHEIYPDTRKAAAPVSVYLPKGTQWFDFWTNEIYKGGQKIQRLCPIDIMPVYVKAGTIMPFGPEVQYSNEKAWDELEIRVYPGADGSFTLYEDEGDNYNYEKGKYSLIRFIYNDSQHRLTIAKRKGKFSGMIKDRKFNIVMVGDDSGRGDQPMKVTKTVNYRGKQVFVDL
ncbi:MAG: glycoside hydrolase family 31 protein [Prevotella sp.]|jgi:alpha-D-xyloside xylohydrolase